MIFSTKIKYSFLLIFFTYCLAISYADDAASTKTELPRIKRSHHKKIENSDSKTEASVLGNANKSKDKKNKETLKDEESNIEKENDGDSYSEKQINKRQQHIHAKPLSQSNIRVDTKKRIESCPLCDSSVFSYCSDKLLHDACCCLNPFENNLPYQCQYADCSFLHANSCREHHLITACCCDRYLYQV